MITIAKTDIPTLAAVHREPCVSIYMPLHGSQPDSKQDHIRFKNLLHQAEEKLIARGMKRTDIASLLGEARELIEGGRAWHADGRKGLAVLIEPNATRCSRSYETLPEAVRVGKRFNLGPLVHAFADSGQFLVLAISANDVHLYRGDRHALELLPLPEPMPKSLKEVEQGSEFDKGLQFHTAAPSSLAGSHVGIMHGHGAPKDDHKTLWSEYLRSIVHHLEPVLHGKSAPLVLAAVDYVHPIFRTVCTYPHLTGAGVSGSPDELSEAELHRKAVDAVSPELTADLKKALDRYRELEPTTRVAFHIETVLPAIEQGRVELLFAAGETQIWGRVDGQKQVLVHRSEESGDVDLLDLAICETIAKGGAAYVIERDDVPSRDPVAAILRW
jgi:Bacterial archaeo-eukaryotic release factor family 6